MASWMVHLRIADKLLEHFNNLDETAFVMGNIAPDSGVPNEDWTKFEPPKKISHFKKEDGDNTTIDIEKFCSQHFNAQINKTYSKKEYSFFLGYYVHLFTDIQWSENIFKPLLAAYPKEAAEDTYKLLWTAKGDWYDLDFLYLKKHPDFRAFSIYENAVNFENEFLDSFSKDAFENRRQYICGFYHSENHGQLDRTYTYLTPQQADAFVDKTVSLILKLTRVRLGRFFSIPDLDKTEGVKTLFTSSCDTAWNFEDDLARENFLALGQQLDISLEDMVKSKQTHTNIVKVVTRENAGDGILRPIDEANAYDGLITNEKNLLLCTVEADCLPVYFYDSVKEIIAMLHSGWKGTVKKISESTLKKMSQAFDCKPENIMVAIGPHICKDCYEVGQDVFNEFSKSFDNAEISKIFTRKNTEKYLLNLQEAVKLTVLKNGVLKENFFSSEICTYHSQIEAYSFCSYRRTKSASERMLTAIMMI